MRRILLLLLLLTCTPALAQSSAVIDVDLDGKPDVVTNDGSNLLVFRGLGGGNFAARARVDGSRAGRVTVSDMNGDGALDLVVVDDSGFDVWLATRGRGLESGGTGKLNEITWLARGADLDGDGTPEVVVVTSDVIFVFVRSEAGWKLSYRKPTPVHAHHVVAADLNGDSCDELCISLTGNAKSWLWKGRKGAQPALSTFSMGAAASYGELGDFNGDGKLDYVCAGQQEIRMALGRGDGTFEDATVTDLGHFPIYQGLGVADFDGDGKDDVTAYDVDQRQTQIFYSGLGPPHALDVPGRGIPIPGDFDGDGRVDLLQVTNNGVVLLRNLDGRKFERLNELEER